MRNWHKISIFILAFTLIWLRRIDILTNAQFWAEDAVFWYKDAYEQGFFSSLITPRNGYFQTVSTLIVGATTFINPIYAPLLSNFFGIIIRAIIIWFLFTDRFKFLSTTSKIFISVYLICMPGLDEVQANITNAHWYLSLYVAMIIISEEPKSKLWKAHDLFFIVLSGLSGPFIIFIIASSVFKYLHLSKGVISIRGLYLFYTRLPYLAMILCGLIQATSIILTFNGTRSHAPLGFSFDVMSSIISSNVFLFSFVPWNIADAGWDNHLLSYTLSTLVITLCVFLYIKGNWQMKVFATLPILIVAFSMAKPQLADSVPQLPTLATGNGSRYFVNIHIAIFSLICVYLFQCIKNKTLKIFFKIYVSVILIVMIKLNFFITPLPDMNWSQGAELINKAKHGEAVSFAVLPPWLTLDLIKK
ncbi:glucosyl transferase [Escherichia coli]|nr:glucosyl transferase [Escherichia coli]